MNEFLPIELSRNQAVLMPVVSQDKEEVAKAEQESKDRISKQAFRSPEFEEKILVYKDCLERCRQVSTDLQDWQSIVIQEYLQAEGNEANTVSLKQLAALEANLQDLQAQLLSEVGSKPSSTFITELQKRLKETPEVFCRIQHMLSARAHQTVADPELELLRARKDRRNMQQAIEKYTDVCSDTSTRWKFLVDQGTLSPEVVEETDYFVSLLELSQKTAIITASSLSPLEKRTLQAQVCQELIASNSYFSSSELEELVGNPDFISDHFLPKLIDTYLNLEQPLKNTKGDLSWLIKSKRVAKLVVVGTLAITVLRGDAILPRSLDQGPPPLSSSASEQVGSEVGSLQNKDKASKNQGGSAKGEVEGAGSGGQKGLSSHNKDSVNEAKNSPLTKEDLEGGEQNEVWTLEGHSPMGLYKETTASDFMFGYRGKGFQNNNGAPRGINYDGEAEFTMNTKTPLVFGNNNFTLAAPYGTYPLPSKSHVTINGQDVPFKLNDHGDGTYSVDIHTEKPIQEAQISLAFTEGDLQIMPPFHEDREKLGISLDKFPSEIQTLMKEAANIPNEKKRAEYIAHYIKMNFTYSLDPQYTDYIYSTDNVQTFFSRVFETKHSDCDVTNGLALLPLLRETGIPTRMAYGFANENGSFGKTPKALEAPEKHGWVEIYHEGKWIPMDATPINMDDYTKDQLGGSISPGSLFDLLKNLPQKLKEGNALSELQEVLYRMLIGSKTSVSDFGQGLNSFEGSAWRKLFGGIGIFSVLQMILYALSSGNQKRYNDTMLEFVEKLKKNSDVQADASLNDFFGLLSDATKGKVVYNKDSKLQNIMNTIMGVTMGPSVVRSYREARRISKLKSRLSKQIEVQKVEHKFDPAEMIAQATKTELGEIEFRIEKRNRNDLLTRVVGGANSDLYKAIMPRLPGHNYLYVPLGVLTKGMTSYQDYENRVLRFIWQNVQKELPKINRRHKKQLTYNQLQALIPETYKRSMVYVYRLYNSEQK